MKLTLSESQKCHLLNFGSFQLNIQYLGMQNQHCHGKKKSQNEQQIHVFFYLQGKKKRFLESLFQQDAGSSEGGNLCWGAGGYSSDICQHNLTKIDFYRFGVFHALELL